MSDHDVLQRRTPSPRVPSEAKLRELPQDVAVKALEDSPHPDDRILAEVRLLDCRPLAAIAIEVLTDDLQLSGIDAVAFDHTVADLPLSQKREHEIDGLGRIREQTLGRLDDLMLAFLRKR